LETGEVFALMNETRSGKKKETQSTFFHDKIHKFAKPAR